MTPVECVARWRAWYVNNSQAVLKRLEESLPRGWHRLREEELAPFRPLVRVGSVWFSDGSATLSLERPQPELLRGGGVRFAGSPTWPGIMRFLDEGIVPAASAAGATAWVPTPSELFLRDLPTSIRDRLQEFSDSSRKTLPLRRDEVESWRSFVLAAHGASTVIDSAAFVAWLVGESWSEKDATGLDARFLEDCQLLSRQAEETLA